MGIEVGSTPEVELPQPPGWGPREDQEPESTITITESVACNKKKERKASPLEKLHARLWQSKLNRQPRSSIKTLAKRQAILDSGATSTFMRPQDGAIPTGEKNPPRGYNCLTEEQSKLLRRSGYLGTSYKTKQENVIFCQAWNITL